MSIIPQHEGAGHACGRPPTAIQCALAIVTAGLAVAAVMLALIASAAAAQARYVADLAGGTSSQASTAPELQSQPAPSPQGSVFTQFQPQSGSNRQASVFTQFQPQPDPTFTPFPQPLPFGGSMSSTAFMPMPVEGRWQVTCGYRCGLHTDANNATFALDIIPTEGEAAGNPVRAPVDGEIIAVGGQATFFCGGQWIHGPEGGTAVVIDFQDDLGAVERLRLIHLDPTTIPDDLRPNDAAVPVEAGTFLGTLAPLDGCGHLHMGLTRLDNTREIPQPFAIEGQALEDCGGEDCWLGTVLPLQAP